MARLYLIGGGVLVVVLLGWRLFAAHERIGELEVRLAGQAQETREAAEANVSNQETIAGLRSRIEASVRERAADAAQRERILLERETELEEARATARRLQMERDNEAETNLECAEYNKLVMADYCPDSADQLRQRSRGEGRHEDGTG